MPQFDSIEALKAYIQAAINDTLQNEVTEVATDAMTRAVDNVVYDYQPTAYQRRDSGGLGSRESVDSTLVGDGHLFVSNKAKSSPSVVDGSVSNNLALWVVEGDVPNIFNGNDYPWMYPRDFIAEAANDLGSGSELMDAIKKGLARHGIQAK